jgi:hypothetical protein
MFYLFYSEEICYKGALVYRQYNFIDINAS